MRGEGGDQNNYYLQKDGHGIAGGDLEEIQNPSSQITDPGSKRFRIPNPIRI